MKQSPKQFEIIAREPLCHSFFRMDRYRLRHSLHAGGWSGEVGREVFSRGDCIAVLLYDPQRDAVVLIEQFRAGSAVHRPESAWLLEIVGGAIEEGEEPEQVAHREAWEEAGCRIEELLVINKFFTTPGCASEWITLFCGKVDAGSVGGIHGLEEEDEDILVSVVAFDDMYRMLQNGRIESGISIIALQWLALNRDWLRQEWGCRS
ncbi:MAG: NUDIX domain-containing protein [Gammaproteobacteria bacterium]